MAKTLPRTMRAVVLKEYLGSKTLVVEERPVPVPQRGQILIQISAASINPSDLVFLRGEYGVRKTLPIIPGFEGAGRVVRAGSGLWPKLLLRRRVACSASETGDGTWAEYMLTTPRRCIPLSGKISDEQGAGMVVNPLTAWNLIQQAKAEGHPAFIQTAAASALGHMLNRLGQRESMTVINIVRREEQIRQLQGLGYSFVLNSEHADFKAQLQTLSDRFRILLAFDAVGGTLTDDVAAALQPGGHIIVYGALSGQACAINPKRLIFERKRVDGFWLTDTLRRKNPLKGLYEAHCVQKLLAHELRTEMQGRFALDDIHQAIELYKTRRSAGKVLLIPSLARRPAASA